jgi:ankyrin repeat protein
MLQEQLMIILFAMSNKMSSGTLTWGYLLGILECSGILSTPMVIPKSAKTLLALHEALFQLVFKIVLAPNKYRIIDVTSNMSRSLRFIEWLLSSGQAADTVVVHDTIWHTPLQIAVHTCSTALLALLLQNGADPNLIVLSPDTFSSSKHSDEHWVDKERRLVWIMPPIALAAYSARNIGDLEAIHILMSFGVGLVKFKTSSGFLTYETVFTIAAGQRNEDVALALMKTLLQVRHFLHEVKHVSCSTIGFILADITIAAAARGNCQVIQLLHDAHFDVTEANDFGLTALHAAAYEGHLECCQQLLDIGFHVDVHSPNLPSPIHLACHQNHFEVVKFLHERGAQIDRCITIGKDVVELITSRYFCRLPAPRNNQEDRKTMTLLQSPFGALFSPRLWYKCACNNNNQEFLQPPFVAYCLGSRSCITPLALYMLGHGSVLPERASSWAALRGDAEMLSIALERGANPNATEIPWGSSVTQTLLQIVLNSLYIDGFVDESLRAVCRARLVTILLDAGADVTYEDAMQIIKLKDSVLANRILERDLRQASINSGNCYGRATLVEVSLLYGHDHLACALLERGSEGYSPGALCAAVLRACEGCVNPGIINTLLLIRDDGFPDEETLELEMTAIGIAACYGSRIILQSLLTVLPVWNIARLPRSVHHIFSDEETGGTPMRYAIEDYDQRGNGDFWRYTKAKGSVVTYAMESGIDIVHTLLRCGFLVDWQAISAMAYIRAPETYWNILPGQQLLPPRRDEQCLVLTILIKRGSIGLLTMLLDERLIDWANEVPNGGIHDRCRNSHVGIAIRLGNSEIFEKFIAIGFDPRASDSKGFDCCGMTALQSAAVFGRVGMAKQLIDLGADVNAKGSLQQGRTALEGAAEHGHIDMVELLLSHGAKTTGTGQQQYIRSIALAERGGHGAVANTLREYRELTDEDESMLRDPSLLRENPDSEAYVDDCSSELARFNMDEDSEVFAEKNCLTERQHPEIPDPTIIQHNDSSVGDLELHDLDYNSSTLELEPDLDPTAPSAGIYDLEEPLFGLDP